MNDESAHTRAGDNLKSVIRKSTNSGYTLDLLLEWHEYHASNFAIVGENFNKFELPHGYHIDKKDMFLYFAKKIDIDIED